MKFPCMTMDGCGDPLERKLDKVKFDADADLLTREGAKRYGVLIDVAGSVDAAAGAALRARMAEARGAMTLFDRGSDSIDKLKSRCLGGQRTASAAAGRRACLDRPRRPP